MTQSEEWQSERRDRAFVKILNSILSFQAPNPILQFFSFRFSRGYQLTEHREKATRIANFDAK